MAMLSVADALDKILGDVVPLPAVSVPLLEAHGRVLAKDVAALRTQPPADVSAMDGYAVRAGNVATVPAALRVIGEVAAGHPYDGKVGANEAARIFTGGLMPEGADTVVIQENTTRDGDIVHVTTATAARRNVRRKGLDFSEGDVLLPRGRRLTDRDLMLAAAMNHPTVPVHAAPKVAILGTGDELVMPGTAPGVGQIVYSNGFGLMALMRAQGAQVVDLGIAPDRIADTVTLIRRAKDEGADILVTTGGASVGDHDLMRASLAAEDLDLSFWKIALRPGRPMMHGRLHLPRGDVHVLGLPGNPVSSYVCAVLFLVPLIRKLSGRADLAHNLESAVLGVDLAANDERADYLRAALRRDADGRWIATPVRTQDSSMMGTLAKADCLVIREAHAPAVPAGTPCKVLRLAF